MAERHRPVITRAQGLRPAQGQPLRKADKALDSGRRANRPFRAVGPSGTPPIWHGVTGTRFAFPLPPTAKGPIRAREVRRQKGADGY